MANTYMKVKDALESMHGTVSADGKVKLNRFNKKKFADLMVALANDTEFTSEVARSVNGGDECVVEEIAVSKEFRKWCRKLVEKAGTIMIVGVTQTPKEASFRSILVKQVVLRGVNMYEDRDFYDAVQIINSGKLDKELRHFVTDVFPLEQAFDAYMTAMDPSGEHVKVLIDCDVAGVIPEQAK